MASIFSSIRDGLSSAASWAWGGVQNIASTIWGGARTVLHDVTGEAKSVVTSTVGAVGDAGGGIVEDVGKGLADATTNLVWPLTAGVAVAGIYLLTKR